MGAVCRMYRSALLAKYIVISLICKRALHISMISYYSNLRWLNVLFPTIKNLPYLR